MLQVRGAIDGHGWPLAPLLATDDLSECLLSTSECV